MKYLILLLSFSICNVLLGAEDDPRQDMKNFDRSGWYVGPEGLIEEERLATEVDESLFPQFERCDQIMEEASSCKHLQKTRKATHDAFVNHKIQEARIKAALRAANMQEFLN